MDNILKKIAFLLSLLILSACASFDKVNMIKKDNIKIELEQPKMTAPEPLILKKVFNPEAFIFENEVVYCLDEKGLKAQIYNTKETKRYLKEMLLYIESLESEEKKKEKKVEKPEEEKK